MVTSFAGLINVSIFNPKPSIQKKIPRVLFLMAVYQASGVLSIYDGHTGSPRVALIALPKRWLLKNTSPRGGGNDAIRQSSYINFYP